MKPIGRYVEESGSSVSQLAEAAGLDTKLVKAIVSGNYTPSPSQRQRLAAILGVSADPVPKQGKFKAKHDLSIMLASDESHEMLEAYGVWAKKSMWGRSYMGILRNTYLIGPDGRIARIWEKAKVMGHAEEVLEAAKEL